MGFWDYFKPKRNEPTTGLPEPWLGSDLYENFPDEESRRAELVRRYYAERNRPKVRIADGVDDSLTD